MTSSPTLLETRALDVGYAHKKLGTNINLHIRAGEIHCVLGPNGGGKTTLFRTVLGLLPALSGEILIGGQNLATLRPAQRARQIAYVPQAGTSHFDFSVREVVLMGRTAHLGLFAQPGAADHAAGEAALNELHLTHLAERTYNLLSGGERQLVLIARALAQAAPLLIMDEPTASLDFGNQALILEELLGLRERGRSVLFCTHDPDQALQCADTALLLHQGRIMAHGEPRDIITAAHLQMLYGVPVQLIQTGNGLPPSCRPMIQPR